MPTLTRGHTILHYDDMGRGPAIIATHGLAENATYWHRSGVTERLTACYRVIAMDMRGHGRTRSTGEPRGFDVETMAEDIAALATHLQLPSFHLLSHATGGMVAVRYATRGEPRLRSLVLTDTGPATAPIADPVAMRAMSEELASGFEGHDWEAICGAMRINPGPFLFQLDRHPDCERLWTIAEQIFRLGDPNTLAAFVRTFYTDPDPHVDRLRGLRVPTLILLGEHDILFIEASALMVREIPRARHAVLNGIGHMTAIEDPERTSAEILRFLDEVELT